MKKKEEKNINIILAKRGQELRDLPREYIYSKIVCDGYVVLRGFPTSVELFSDFVRSCSSTISLDPARSFDGQDARSVAQTVDAGKDPVGLHCENGNSPFWPDMCWFYCRVPPETAGQTTVYDGHTVYDAMSLELREYFSQNILYERNVPNRLWRKYVEFIYAEEGETASNLSDQELYRYLCTAVENKNVELVLNSDRSLTYRFITSPVRHDSLFSPGLPSFANSIFGPSYNYERPSITFTDGEPLHKHHLTTMENLCEEHILEILWKSDDIVLIDNRRVMHGRRRIQDEKRSICNALSNAIRSN